MNGNTNHPKWFSYFSGGWPWPTNQGDIKRTIHGIWSKARAAQPRSLGPNVSWPGECMGLNCGCWGFMAIKNGEIIGISGDVWGHQTISSNIQQCWLGNREVADPSRGFELEKHRSKWRMVPCHDWLPKGKDVRGIQHDTTNYPLVFPNMAMEAITLFIGKSTTNGPYFQ